MATLTIKTYSEQEERALIAFLKSLDDEFSLDNTAEYVLTEEQEKEIIRREIAFCAGETTARDWGAIKSDLDRVYR